MSELNVVLFTNKLVKSVIALTRNTTKDQFKNGLLMRFHADVSQNISIAVLLWRSKKDFEEAEKTNGRWAMLGFVALLGAYITTGQIIPGVF